MYDQGPGTQIAEGEVSRGRPLIQATLWCCSGCVKLLHSTPGGTLSHLPRARSAIAPRKTHDRTCREQARHAQPKSLHIFQLLPAGLLCRLLRPVEPCKFPLQLMRVIQRVHKGQEGHTQLRSAYIAKAIVKKDGSGTPCGASAWALTWRCCCSQASCHLLAKNRRGVG